MPGSFQLIPLAVVQNDYDFYWPPMATTHVAGDPFDGNLSQRYTGNLTAMWTLIGGGTSNMQVDPRWGIIGQLASLPLGQTRQATGTGFNFRPALYAGGPGPTFLYPAWGRVWRWQVTFQLQAVVNSSLGRQTFLGMIPNGGAGPDAVGASYFGIVLSAAGRWQWVTRAGGIGFGFSDQVDLFAAATTPHTIDLVILEATGKDDAICQLFLDGAYQTPAVQRPFTAGGVLPNYQSTVVNAMGWQTRMQANDPGVVTVLQILKCRWMVGQFNPAGMPV